MKGKLIVIEGLDGSGKATQAALLTDALRRAGRAVRAVAFPNYESDASALIKMYLSGAFGQEPEAVNAYAASSFYAVDRYAAWKQDWGEFYRAGGVIVADRYTTSNAVYQCAKLPREKWDEYLDWLFTYEYALLGIPEPDLVLYLRVDTALSQALMSGRYAGDEGKKDIHERNRAFLDRSGAAAEYCAEKLGWRVIDCVSGGQMRPPEEIHARLLALAEECVSGAGSD